MADRRSARSSNRRITPTPQPPSTAPTPQAGRTTRKRGTRSASRDVETAPSPVKPTRRSARQMSVTSEGDAKQTTARTKSRGQKEMIQDLTVVEEVDTQLEIEIAPKTPPRYQEDVSALHRSPGAASEMSGTTAISSFSVVEAEDLNPKNMLRSLPKLYEAADEFIAHLAPDDARLEDDASHIQSLQMPDSDFSNDYRFFDDVFRLHLGHFCSEQYEYINTRAVRRALLGPDQDPSVLQSPLDLILYKANVLTFAKQGITLGRGKGDTFQFLRIVDNAFPGLFLSAITRSEGSGRLPVGESALLTDTFDLGLELRTHLFIAIVERSSTEDAFDPDHNLQEVFLRDDKSTIRGWDILGLGGVGLEGKESQLPRDLARKAMERMKEIRKFFPEDTQSLQQGETVEDIGLTAAFPFEGFLFQLLHWVRLRNREIEGQIQDMGGVAKIVRDLKSELDNPRALLHTAGSAPVGTPRQSRTSFGRHRRRSSRKFDPNAAPDNRVVDALLAKERGAKVRPQQQQAESSQQARNDEEEMQWQASVQLMDEDDWQPVTQDDVRELEPEPEVTAAEKPPPSTAPRSTAEILRLNREAKKLDKENRGFFAEQPNARRVDFGTGFDDSQPATASKEKGKQRGEYVSKKRPRQFPEEDNDDDDDDDDAFETEERSAKVQERREKAPVKKRVRIDPSSSAPTSHQPPARKARNELFVSEEQEESISEVEAPDMTEEAPPPSTWPEQRNLALSNGPGPKAYDKARKPRTVWSAAAEEAFLEYMEMLPQRYSRILEHDKSDAGYKLLLDRTQVNLKDKARNMAMIMIKSGYGLRPGFENIILPTSAIGKRLMEDGHEW